MNTAEFIATIRSLLVAGDLRAAIRKLNELLANSPKLNEAIMLSGRFERIREQGRLGLIQPETIAAEEADIQASLQDLLDYIEVESQQPGIQAEVAQALSVMHSKNVVGGSISARDVSIGDTKIEHHHYGERSIPRALTQPPFLPEVFLGRKQELQDIHERLFSPDGHLLLLVNGKGGVGKTSLASQYYHRYQREYQHMAWVLSDKSIAQALLLLAQPLGLQFEQQADTLQRLPILLKALANLKQPCLLVIDNANELNDLEAHYADLRRCSNFHLLLTTRITHFQQAACYRIEGLPEPEALALFRQYYPRLSAAEETGVKEIRNAVNGNTLVLELLAKTLAQRNRLKIHYALADLLHDLRSKGLLQLRQSEAVATDYGKLRNATPEEIVAAMYDLSELPQEEKTLLSVFAVLPAENIAFEVLEQTFPDMPELEKPLLSLAQQGWIEHNETEAAFKCSPVVQEIVRHHNSQLRADCEELIDALVDKLKYEPGIGHLLNATYEEGLLYNRYAESVSARFAEPDTRLRILFERMGRYQRTTGNLNQALAHFEQARQMDQALCERAPDDADAKNNLAISYEKLGSTHTALGNLQQALTFYEQDLQLTKELYEAYPQNVAFKNGLAISYQNLGNTHTSLGNLQQALTDYEQFNQLEQALYEAYPQNVAFKNGLAISYSKLGETHTSLGNLQQALTDYEQYHQLEQALYDAYPQNVAFKNGLAISYSKLGETHTSLGNLQQALTFYEQFNQLEQALYEAYPQNVGFKNGLAISYQKLGNTHTSLGNLQQALTFYEQYHQLEQALYEAYPQNVAFKNGLALSYQWLGWFHEKQLQDMETAKEYYLLSQALLSQLVDQFPDYVEFRKSLDWVADRLKE